MPYTYRNPRNSDTTSSDTARPDLVANGWALIADNADADAVAAVAQLNATRAFNSQLATLIAQAQATFQAHMVQVVGGGQPGGTATLDGSGQVPLSELGNAPGGGAVADATTSTKGVVQLAGDLAGTAAAPTVPGLAGKAAASHSHTETDVTSLSTDLAGKLVKASNLSDLGSAGTARTNLGLGGAALLAVGTAAGTVAAGDDTRITGAAQKSSNLSDLASVSTARTNLGLGAAALLASVVDTATLPAADASVPVIGANTTGAPSDHKHGRVNWSAPDLGLLAWSYDPANAAGNFQPSSGVVNFGRVHLPYAASVTNGHIHVVGSAGTTYVSGQNWIGLWNAATGALVAVSADLSTVVNSNGFKTIAWASGPYALAAGDYLIGLCVNFTSTVPQYLKAGSTPAINGLLTGTNIRFGSAGSGLTTPGTAPNPIGTLTAQPNALWVGLS